MTEPLPPAGPPPRERREEYVTETVWYREPVWIAAVLAFVVLLVILAIFLARVMGPDEPDTVILDPDVEVEVDDPIEVEVTTPDAQVDVEVSPSPSPSPAVTPAPADEEEEAPEPIQADGSGGGTVEVEHEGGLALIRVRHEGGAFTLHVTDEQGEQVEDFEMVGTGQYEGSRALPLEAGSYQLVISADGDWGVSFEQPRYVAGEELPMAIEGRNDKATEPFQTDGGQIRFAWEADDPGALSFRILDADGEVVAEDLGGPGFGEESVELDAGLYLLDVQGDDVWRLEIS